MARVGDLPVEHDPLEWDTPLFRMALAQFEQALPYADVSQGVAERLRSPERALIVSVPIRLDSDERKVFPGYRVQHSSALGPSKGGIRYDPAVSLGECAALSMQVGYAVPEIVTGKPISIGGSVFRPEVTGAGVVMVIERACDLLGLPLPEQRCLVQGFGKVGAVAAFELAGKGASVVGISDFSGGIYDEGGLDLEAVREWTTANDHLAGYPDARTVSNAEFLEQPCDVLVLAALEDQVTGENAGRVQARMIAEGANGPTSLEADAILAERGIPVLPDVLTNAGGVTVSYFEWVQDLGRLFWDRDEIRARLADKMQDAFERVWTLSGERAISLRSAALVVGIREVAAALEARGLYP